MSRSILAIDDNPSALLLLRDFLEGQSFEVITATGGQEALELMAANSPDIVLLDVMMPQMDGYQFISRVRRSSSGVFNNNVPIIMLTAKRQESDVIRGFELGADDYIVKPYRMRELLMRIRAVMRRSGGDTVVEARLTIGNLSLNKQSYSAAVGDVEVDLTPVEFYLLEKLLISAEMPVHRAELATLLIEQGYSGSENTIKIHIRNLRQKIEPDPKKPIYIETVFGIGYRLREISA